MLPRGGGHAVEARRGPPAGAKSCEERSPVAHASVAAGRRGGGGSGPADADVEVPLAVAGEGRGDRLVFRRFGEAGRVGGKPRGDLDAARRQDLADRLRPPFRQARCTAFRPAFLPTRGPPFLPALAAEGAQKRIVVRAGSLARAQPPAQASRVVRPGRIPTKIERIRVRRDAAPWVIMRPAMRGGWRRVGGSDARCGQRRRLRGSVPGNARVSPAQGRRPVNENAGGTRASPGHPRSHGRARERCAWRETPPRTCLVTGWGAASAVLSSPRNRARPAPLPPYRGACRCR